MQLNLTHPDLNYNQTLPYLILAMTKPGPSHPNPAKCKNHNMGYLWLGSNLMIFLQVSLQMSRTSICQDCVQPLILTQVPRTHGCALVSSKLSIWTYWSTGQITTMFS
jgi:hypothetical protein